VLCRQHSFFSFSSIAFWSWPTDRYKALSHCHLVIIFIFIHASMHDYGLSCYVFTKMVQLWALLCTALLCIHTSLYPSQHVLDCLTNTVVSFLWTNEATMSVLLVN
jgi:hypothetical protein